MIFALDINPDTFVPARFTNIATFINVLLPLLQVGAALVFLMMGLYGAFIWLTAGDNQENLAKAQKTFTYAVLGLIIIIISFVLVKLIGYFLQISILP